jgi:1,4-alpha-glucan branching enzyme
MLAVHVACAMLTVAPLASHDNNVEWDGVSHIGWLDRSPTCPVLGESFVVSFQTYHYDCTSARVYVNDGVGMWVDAAWSHRKGAYDVWTAEVPSTISDSLTYYIELTDGTDSDYLGEPGLGSWGMSETDPPATAWTVDYDTLSHAPYGATMTTDGGAVFRVWAPNSSTCAARGAFNGWGETSIDSVGDDFIGHLANVDEGDEYKFFFNGANWAPDARAFALNPSNNNNSVIVNLDSYGWSDGAFVTPPWEEMVIYELHVGTFSGYGDGLNRAGRLRDIVDTHLDHLLYLGVNVVELLPITEFDYHESWGYNPICQWSVEDAYGSPDDLKYVVDVLHQHGIAVLLDVVYNHFSYGGNYLWYYDGTQFYFDNPACDTPWGSQAKFDSAGVQSYFFENILFWLDEYHIDGYRMDATSYMRDPLGCYSEGWYLMQDMNDAIDIRAASAISIAEELPDNQAVTRPTADGGAGFDSQWHDRFNDDIRSEVFDASFGDPEIWRMRNAISNSDYPDKTKVVNYIESHDEAGNGQRLAIEIDSGDPYSVYAKGRTKVAQGLAMLAPGIPMFLQGGEWMETRQFGSGSGNRINWNWAEDHAPIVRFFRDVIGVRKSNCGLRSDAGFELAPYYGTDEMSQVLVFHRFDYAGNDLIIVASLNNDNLTNYRIGFPQAGTWYEILNSQADVYDGNGWGNGGLITTEGVEYHGHPNSAEITIPQMGLLVFRYEDPAGRSGDLDSDGDRDLRDYALLANAMGTCGCGLGADLQENGRVDIDDYAVFAGEMMGPN